MSDITSAAASNTATTQQSWCDYLTDWSCCKKNESEAPQENKEAWVCPETRTLMNYSLALAILHSVSNWRNEAMQGESIVWKGVSYLTTEVVAISTSVIALIETVVREALSWIIGTLALLGLVNKDENSYYDLFRHGSQLGMLASLEARSIALQNLNPCQDIALNTTLAFHPNMSSLLGLDKAKAFLDQRIEEAKTQVAGSSISNNTSGGNTSRSGSDSEFTKVNVPDAVGKK